MSASELLEHQPWTEAYQLALLETDLSKRAHLVERAALEITIRVAQLSKLPSFEGKSLELDSIIKALEVLRMLVQRSEPSTTMVM